MTARRITKEGVELIIELIKKEIEPDRNKYPYTQKLIEFIFALDFDLTGRELITTVDTLKALAERVKEEIEKYGEQK